ncbi:malto-oligosyltrehalose trehalohydrolase [Streptomyces sp. LHD-70]|uniref:malto-oligosyltrehalose trehalohydrolase n=1 Tax=Streptomyces sp. LHD-70 TaxID=3072140 RepID=UPI00281076F2|nr:malto-oligosyltrehalose trehalohydrolase [Streptomyces sp. LHD-70]MDQ8703681.1 malto-oligosyltrehalose trehalohydrolase [Streptomyces sp. LHD-70]
MQFEVWAPQAQDRVTLQLEGSTRALERDPERRDWWVAEAEAEHGARYGYVVDGDGNDDSDSDGYGDSGGDGDAPSGVGSHARSGSGSGSGEAVVLPDPRSLCQPDGPSGLSAVVDHEAYTWRTPWPGKPLTGASVLYELHVGTFTREGTLDAAAQRLGHVAELGATHVQLMPLCPLPGRHGWGYEGGSPWAVHEPYGGPDALKRFVDTAHGLGLGVVLDVVHHQLDPSKTQLAAYGPYFVSGSGPSNSVNLDAEGSDEVRSYLIGSALSWLRDFRIDGLRLDSVDALRDTRACHFLEELSGEVDDLAAELGRPLFLVADSEQRDPRLTTPRQEGGLGVHAQWNEDFHHALHTALTGEEQGPYADFAPAPLKALGKTLTSAFFHDGGYSTARGRGHGRPADRARTPAHRFVGYAQSHAQVGKRAQGDRLSASLAPGLLACAAALTLTSPCTPMVFMGEEWAAGTPWQFFTDHPDPESVDAVRRAHKREFAAQGWEAQEIPDPLDPETRNRSCLNWDEPQNEHHARVLAWYRTLIALRRSQSDLRDPDLAAVRVAYDEAARWLVFRRGDLRIAVNLAKEPAAIPLLGGKACVLASWEPIEAPAADGILHLPAESCVVLGPLQ